MSKRRRNRRHRTMTRTMTSKSKVTKLWGQSELRTGKSNKYFSLIKIYICITEIILHIR